MGFALGIDLIIVSDNPSNPQFAQGRDLIEANRTDLVQLE